VEQGEAKLEPQIKLYCKRSKKGGTSWSQTGTTNKIILQKVEKVEQGGATLGPQIKLY
jgi:hypothetical protein